MVAKFMEGMEYVLIIEGLMASICLMYKMHQQSKFQNPERRPSIAFLFSGHFNLFPISKVNIKSEDDRIIVSRGNFSLLLFWLIFIIILIESAL